MNVMIPELELTRQSWINIGEHMKKKHPNAKYFGTSMILDENGDTWEICQLCGEKLTKM